MSQQDWTPVVLRKNPTSVPKTATSLAAAKAKGQVETVARVHHTAPSNAAKLDDNEAPDFKHQTVTHDFKLAMQKARQAKGWTQAELAQKCNVKTSVITDYESGKAIPQPGFISQLNRILGTVLPKIPKKKVVADDD
jgi:putative transcription factor